MLLIWSDLCLWHSFLHFFYVTISFTWTFKTTDWCTYFNFYWVMGNPVPHHWPSLVEDCPQEALCLYWRVINLLYFDWQLIYCTSLCDMIEDGFTLFTLGWWGGTCMCWMGKSGILPKNKEGSYISTPYLEKENILPLVTLTHKKIQWLWTHWCLQWNKF